MTPCCAIRCEEKAYALTSATEYFAESTEAFFGTNDFYPFVRPELKEHDKEMCGSLAGSGGIVTGRPIAERGAGTRLSYLPLAQFLADRFEPLGRRRIP